MCSPFSSNVTLFLACLLLAALSSRPDGTLLANDKQLGQQVPKQPAPATSLAQRSRWNDAWHALRFHEYDATATTAATGHVATTNAAHDADAANAYDANAAATAAWWGTTI